MSKIRLRTLFLALALVLVAGCSKAPAPQPQYTPTSEPLPADFAAAFDAYRPEGTRGWTFTQETTTAKQRLKEHHDGNLPEFKRWTLLEKDGRAPTAEESKEYNDMIARRPRSDNAPNVRDQVLRDSWRALEDSPDGHKRFHFRLKPGAEDDRSAAFMAVVFQFDPATKSISAVELRSESPFKPTFGVSIQEASTRVRYHAPQGERPVLIRDIDVKVRGKAFGFKSLDQDMNVRYFDYQKPQTP
ncbi:MAG: hypothetical protein SFV32_13010 [Opitutaceae bacterium]|nr:hypothetical protein [Opitutaceae bacterium]